MVLRRIHSCGAVDEFAIVVLRIQNPGSCQLVEICKTDHALGAFSSVAPDSGDVQQKKKDAGENNEEVSFGDISFVFHNFPVLSGRYSQYSLKFFIC